MRKINVIEDNDLIVVSIENAHDVVEYKFTKDKFMELIEKNAHEINSFKE